MAGWPVGLSFRRTRMRELAVSCSDGNGGGGGGVEGLEPGEIDPLLGAAFALAFLMTSVLSFRNIKLERSR